MFHGCQSSGINPGKGLYPHVKKATWHYLSRVAQDMSMCRHVLVAYMLDGRCHTSLHNSHHTLAGLSAQRKATQLNVRAKRQAY